MSAKPTIRHLALAHDYFDDAAMVRVFVCETCGALIANDLIEIHERWHSVEP